MMIYCVVSVELKAEHFVLLCETARVYNLSYTLFVLFFGSVLQMDQDYSGIKARKV